MTEKKSPARFAIEIYKLWSMAGMGFPVNIEVLATEFSKNLPDPISKVVGKDLLDIDGMLHKRQKGDWYILYNDTINNEGRTRFTQAHEFGHYILHRKEQDNFECGQEDLLDYDSRSTIYLRESEANRFASFLLMPTDDFRLQIEKETISIDLLSGCANRYGVSLIAAILKWIDFTDEAALLAIARDDFICWAYSTKSARKFGVYKRKGMPIPEETLLRIKGCSSQKYQNIRVSNGIWHPHLEAEESVVISDQYDMSIILIRFPMPYVDCQDYQQKKR